MFFRSTFLLYEYFVIKWQVVDASDAARLAEEEEEEEEEIQGACVRDRELLSLFHFPTAKSSFVTVASTRL